MLNLTRRSRAILKFYFPGRCRAIQNFNIPTRRRAIPNFNIPRNCGVILELNLSRRYSVIQNFNSHNKFTADRKFKSHKGLYRIFIAFSCPTMQWYRITHFKQLFSKIFKSLRLKLRINVHCNPVKAPNEFLRKPPTVTEEYDQAY